ncbi:MAG TPA: hypothetical protein VFL96_08310 [Acidobacteriaceae bacterium]|nr:hypothetical protein [Acidobacteriaceae bacterium]
MASNPIDLLQQIRDIAEQALAEAQVNDSPDFQREVLRLDELIKELVTQTQPRTNTL